ncbi:MAG: class IV adenylate cyclase [Eubacterium sp.]|nr:class IV adenylate cyclase [Eubacterium sp.]
MIEVEIKLPLKSLPAAERALVKMNFKTGDVVEESDIYFNNPSHDFRKTDEALRIRTSENLTRNRAETVITYKGPKLDSVSMTRKELETTVGDPDIMKELLISLGYEELAPVIKLRMYYHRDDIHACLDQVRDLGSFLELEILVEDESQKEAALKRIEAILIDLGYSLSDTTRYSYLYMLQQKR